MVGVTVEICHDIMRDIGRYPTTIAAAVDSAVELVLETVAAHC